MTKWKYVLAIASCLLASCQMSAFEQSTTSSTAQSAQHSTVDSKLSIVTTFYPVYYMTKAITGDVANVTMLVDGAIDSHDYEPSAKDIATINESNVFIYSNAQMETWVPRLIDSLGKQQKTTVVATAKQLDDTHTNQHTETNDVHHDMDPHVWLDPVLAKEQVNVIATALIAKNPQHKETYTKNKDAFIAKLEHLAQSYHDVLSTVSNKTFITQHAAFGYIAKRYGLEQIAITGLQATEPSPKDITEIIEKMKAHQLDVIYVDPTASQKTAQTVAETTGAKILPLYTIEQEVDGKDYLQLLESNLDSLKKSLQ